jgi:hypothetical protein
MTLPAAMPGAPGRDGEHGVAVDAPAGAAGDGPTPEIASASVADATTAAIELRNAIRHADIPIWLAKVLTFERRYVTYTLDQQAWQLKPL